MWLLSSLGCIAAVHVETSVPEAEVGIVSSSSRPSEQALSARHRGEGEVRAKVPYSVFDTWWAWAKAEGYETTIVKLPTSVAGVPTVSCGLGLFFHPLLAGCFFVTKPKRATVHLELQPIEPEEPEVEPALAIPVPGPAEERPPPPPAVILRPRQVPADESGVP